VGKSIADLVENADDDMGHRILTMYGRKPPEYAVYGTDQRVKIQYADEPTVASRQRNDMAPLNPLRGEITGWIDGWRRGKAERRADAARYELRVAGALVLALEGDTATAQGLLAGVRQDILSERLARARAQYVVYALGAAASVIVVALLMSSSFDIRTSPQLGDALALWRGAGAGAMGAFFSIAVALHSRTVLPDLQWLDNALDALLRVAIGAIAGAVLVGLIRSDAVTISLGGTDPASWLSVLTAGFVAGFSERLVQDLLAKVEVKTKPPTEPSVTALGGGTGGRGAPTSVAPPPAGPSDDGEAHAHEGGVDHCLENITVEEGEVTKDDDLPPAFGGVAKPEGKGAR